MDADRLRWTVDAIVERARHDSIHAAGYTEEFAREGVEHQEVRAKRLK
jgi:hypothetical protein